jgi:hypothetical protein
MIVQLICFILTLTSDAAIIVVNILDMNSQNYWKIRASLQLLFVFGTLPIDYILFQLCNTAAKR